MYINYILNMKLLRLYLVFIRLKAAENVQNVISMHSYLIIMK